MLLTDDELVYVLGGAALVEAVELLIPNRSDQLSHGPVNRLRPYFKRLDRLAAAKAIFHVAGVYNPVIGDMCHSMAGAVWLELEMTTDFTAKLLRSAARPIVILARLKTQYDFGRRWGAYGKAIRKQATLMEIIKERVPQRAKDHGLYPTIIEGS
jgi:hypothetical protein